VRRFCEANGAALIVKARAKDPVPGYLARSAHAVLYDESYYPATVLEIMSIASLCVHFLSSIAYEAAAAAVRRSVSRHLATISAFRRVAGMVLQSRRWRELQLPGVVHPLGLDAVLHELPSARLSDFPLELPARARYIEKFIGFDDAKCSDRVLDASSPSWKGAVDETSCVHFERATAPPGRVRASGGWGAMSGPPYQGRRARDRRRSALLRDRRGSSNHNGSLPQALALIDVASEAGADAVKFQGFRARTLYPRNAGKSDYLKDERSIYDIIEAMEMPLAWIPSWPRTARPRCALPLHAVRRGVGGRAPAARAGLQDRSYEVSHLPLIRRVLGFGKPTFVSTGLDAGGRDAGGRARGQGGQPPARAAAVHGVVSDPAGGRQRARARNPARATGCLVGCRITRGIRWWPRWSRSRSAPVSSRSISP